MEFDLEKHAEDIPIGFGLSMAMNAKAMEHFSQMSEEERNSWLAKAGQVKSKTEMNHLVSQIGESRYC